MMKGRSRRSGSELRWSRSQTPGLRGLHGNNPPSAAEGQNIGVELGEATLLGHESKRKCLSWCADEQKVSQVDGCFLASEDSTSSCVVQRKKRRRWRGKRKRKRTWWWRRRGRKVPLKDPAIGPWLDQLTQRFTRTCEMEETRYELDFISDHTEWDYTDSIYLCKEKSLSAVTVCAVNWERLQWLCRPWRTTSRIEADGGREPVI